MAADLTKEVVVARLKEDKHGSGPAQIQCVSLFRPSVRPSVHLFERLSGGSLVRPSVRPSVRPTIRPSVRPSVRPTVRSSDRPTVRPPDRPSKKIMKRTRQQFGVSDKVVYLTPPKLVEHFTTAISINSSNNQTTKPNVEPTPLEARTHTIA